MNYVQWDRRFQNKNWERREKSLTNSWKRWLMKESVN